MGSDRANPSKLGDAIMSKRRVDKSGGHEHGRLRRRVRYRLEHAAGQSALPLRSCADAGSKASGNIRNR